MKTYFALVGLAISCILSGCAHGSKNNTTSKPVTVAAKMVAFTNYYTLDGSFPGPGAAVAAKVVTFTNTYAGTAPLNYQWYSINTNIQPATNGWPLVLQGLLATNSAVPGHARGKRPLHEPPGYDLHAGHATNAGAVPLLNQSDSITNIQPATNNTVTNTSTTPMVYHWQSNDANIGFDADTVSASTDLLVGFGYSIQLLESCPDTIYWPQTTAPNERTDYSIMILKPSPDAHYCLQIIKPNEDITYALQILHE